MIKIKPADEIKCNCVILTYGITNYVTEKLVTLSLYGINKTNDHYCFVCYCKHLVFKITLLIAIQRFSNGAPQELARYVTLEFRKFTTCFLHYSLFSGIYKIGYDDHLEVVRYPTLQLLQPYSWHKTLFLACCST